MEQQDRKAATAMYKERGAAYGVYAVICTATGEVWVGRSRHVDTQQNSLWFALKLGTSPYASLQSAWRQHGADEFRFEELDRLRDDYPLLSRWDELKKRQELWRSRLKASSI
ncbi:MAG: GIY-YIG nuclease family protein [Caulobacteraceae bacterium]